MSIREIILIFIVSLFLIFALLFCDEKALESQDTIPPASITTLRLTNIGINSITLVWEATGDDSLSGIASKYDLRYYHEPITTNNWLNAEVVTDMLSPSASGNTEVKTITDLFDYPVYYFTIKSVDDAGNWSGLSNIVFCNISDTISPNPITDLHIINSDSVAVTLGWTSTGDDSIVGTAFSYDMRYSTATITEQNWSNAILFEEEPFPQIYGNQETMIIDNLHVDTTYYIALKVVDIAGNWSELSNIVSIRINPIDTIPPEKISDLSLLRMEGDSATLTWTSPGDDSSVGTATYYEIRYNRNEITESNWNQSNIVQNDLIPQVSGNTEEYQVVDLSGVTTYYFAIKAFDESGNGSGISNIIEVNTIGTGKVLWKRTYGGSGIDQANSVIVDSYGDIVVTGKTNSIGAGGYDVYAIKTDSDGNKIWDKTFGGIEDDYGVDLVEADDGGYTIAGVTNSFGENPSNVILINTDLNGYEDWTKIHGSSTTGYGLYGFDKRYNGGYLLSGTHRPTGYCIITDINGNLQNINEFRGNNCTDDYGTYYGEGRGFEIMNLSNNYFAFTYYIYSWDQWGHTGCGMPTDNTILNVYNQYGSKVWSTSIGITCGLIIIDESSDNELLVRTSCWGGGSALKKYDLDGNLQWDIDWGYSTVDMISNIEVTFVLSKSGNGFILSKLDNSGTIVGEFIYEDGNYPIEPKALALTIDDNLIITGYQNSMSNSTQVFLIKIKSDF